MKKMIIKALLLLLSGGTMAMAQTGQWKSYLSYYEPTEIEKAPGNMLYVLASNGLYSYDEDDQSLQTYDKTTVLNDCGIAHIAWNQVAKRLVIVYQNNNIDLLAQNSDVVNMADYMQKSMAEDKTVNAVDVSGQYAYLSTGFGIIKLDVAEAIIADTYQLGFAVDYSYTDGTYLYAASSQQGLYRGKTTDNLLDRANWRRVGDYVARPKTMDADKLAIVKKLQIDGPKYNHFGSLRIQNGMLYTVGGGYNVVNDLLRPGCVQVLSGGQWTIYEDDIATKTGVSFVDLNSVAVDPKDPTHVFAAGRTGLYEFHNGLFSQLHTYDNSPLVSTYATNKEYVVVHDIMFDAQGSLWCLNSLNNSQNILELKPDRQWVSHRSDALYDNGNGLVNMRQILFDSRGLMWFVNDSYQVPSFYAYQSSTGATKSFRSFVNDDNQPLTPTYIHTIAEDHDQNIWIGMNIGPVMLKSSEITAENPVLTQVKVPRNDGTNYADYLLSGVDISCMVIDQTNRKWFGTNGNGIFLISADNIHQLQHLTQSNSKLLSNNIESMAIDATTGELFIGTDKGLCSYMTNAATAADGMTKDNVYAYPNPVKPEYTGAITITGLDEDADVKIVTVNGSLVAAGRASGGQFKWYGLDRSGRRVASGIYMVEVATAQGEKAVVCRIAIVN